MPFCCQILPPSFHPLSWLQVSALSFCNKSILKVLQQGETTSSRANYLASSPKKPHPYLISQSFFLHIVCRKNKGSIISLAFSRYDHWGQNWLNTLLWIWYSGKIELMCSWFQIRMFSKKFPNIYFWDSIKCKWFWRIQ